MTVWMRILLCVSVVAAWTARSPAGEGPAPGPASGPTKTRGVFYPAHLVERARVNAQRDPWAANVRQRIIRAATPWLKLSDNELWGLMFGNTIHRSWMVWSNGHCPACGKSVPMYNWQIDAMGRPWKVRCPHCRELFPKNDFAKFYRSGLDEQGLFDPERADRSLLFNVEHPDPGDPLHRFGVDDGEGYVDGDKRWRFIGAYLIYGQWKQAVLGGIARLAEAYTVTGDAVYAHKAGVLLDRVADLYPTFDFRREGVLYEGPGSAGYLSTWHDACVEVRQLALAYDQVFDGMAKDEALAAFLSQKAKEHYLANPKTSFALIQSNIEDRIFRDTLRNRPKIESNYPQTDMTIAVIKTVLGWPENREDVMGVVDGILRRATAVDGVSGEKGMAGYALIAPHNVAEILGRYGRVDPRFLAEAYKRFPQLHDMFRFHLDMLCLGQYYPRSGDTGAFAHKTGAYSGVSFTKDPGLGPSGYTFLWNLYKLTGDDDLVRLLYRANGNTTDGLPYDLLADDPAAFQKRVREAIEAKGTDIRLGSVNKGQWHLAVLRSGQGEHARAVWLDYDSGHRHGHADAMTLGLFARGLDLLPDFGYPPVQYGGWGSPRATWYTRSAAHNTVVVDGANSRSGAGTTTLWADGRRFRAIRASGPGLAGGQQFERTVAAIDLSEKDFYVVDVFRVVGGRDHAKFVYGHFGEIAAEGLSLQPAEDYGHGTQLRNFRKDADPPPVWQVDWKIDDRLGYLPPGSDVHLRYTDLTADAAAYMADAWVSIRGFGASDETWIPCVMVRRQGETAPLASTFVGLFEPYEKKPAVKSVRRLPLQTADGKPLAEDYVALEIELTDGRRDLFLAADVENPLKLGPPAGDPPVLIQKDHALTLGGQMCLLRTDAGGNVQHLALCRATSLKCGKLTIKLKRPADLLELRLDNGAATVVSGSPDDIELLQLGGKP